VGSLPAGSRAYPQSQDAGKRGDGGGSVEGRRRWCSVFPAGPDPRLPAPLLLFFFFLLRQLAAQRQVGSSGAAATEQAAQPRGSPVFRGFRFQALIQVEGKGRASICALVKAAGATVGLRLPAETALWPVFRRRGRFSGPPDGEVSRPSSSNCSRFAGPLAAPGPGRCKSRQGRWPNRTGDPWAEPGCKGGVGDLRWAS